MMTDNSTSGNSTKRDFEELMLRAVTEDDDESGAISIGTILKGGLTLIPTAIDGLEHIFGNQ